MAVMELHVLAGDDDQANRKRHVELLAQAGADTGAELLDVADDGGARLLEAISALSLFGGRRVVVAHHIEELDETSAARIIDAAAESDAFVIAYAQETLPTKLRKALAAIGTITTAKTPKGKGIAMRVDELACAAGLRLGGDLRRLLVERCGHDLDRVDSICRQLVSAGIGAPNRSQVETLLGTAAGAGVPWALTDALEAGDLAGALRAADDLEAIPAVAYLHTRALHLGRLVESGVTDPDAAAELLGLNHRFQAERLIALTRRLGPAKILGVWGVLAGADRAVKHTKDQRGALSALVIRLAPLYAPTQRR